MKHIILFLFAIVFSASTFGQVPAKQPNTYVNDYVGVLTDAEKLDLNKLIKDLDTTSSVQLAIVIVDKIPDDFGTISDFGMAVGHAWGVGNAQNGLVYTLAISQHKQDIEVGRRLEGTMTDATCLHITDDMKPDLKAKRWHDALVVLIQKIHENVDVKEQKQIYADKVKKDADENSLTGNEILLIALGIGGIIGLIIYFVNKDAARRRREEEEAAEATRNYFKNHPIRPQPQTHTTTTHTKKHTETKKKEDNDNDTPYIPYTPPVQDTYTPPSYTPDPPSDFGNFGGSDSFGGGGASNDF